MADVHEALAYYHRYPEEIQEIRGRRGRIAEAAEPLETPESSVEYRTTPADGR